MTSYRQGLGVRRSVLTAGIAAGAFLAMRDEGTSFSDAASASRAQPVVVPRRSRRPRPPQGSARGAAAATAAPPPPSAAGRTADATIASRRRRSRRQAEARPHRLIPA